MADSVTDTMPDELLRIRAHAAETLRFFSNENKAERERCVVRAFLRGLAIPFNEADLLIKQPEPIDVAAFDARFQITEVLDDDRKRHHEYRQWLERVAAATNLADLADRWKSPRPATYATIVNSVRERLRTKPEQDGIDALVYVNRTDVFLDVESAVPDAGDLVQSKWRSVSMLCLPRVLVLCAKISAPSFLRDARGVPREAHGSFEPT
jgi:hypothetical protein